MLIQATHMGLFAHQMGGYDVEKAKEVLVIPTRYEPMSMMAIGYKDGTEKLTKEDAAWEERDRSRMEISKFLVSGKCK